MMRILFSKFTLLCLFASLFFVACQEDQLTDQPVMEAEPIGPKSQEGTIIPGQYVLLFEDGVIAPAKSYTGSQNFRSREEKGAFMIAKGKEIQVEIQEFLNNEGIDPDQVLHYYTSVVTGIAVKLTESQYEVLKNNKSLKGIEYDREVSLPEIEVKEDDKPERYQYTPCGITNAGGYSNANQSRWIWILDTGIDLDHPDLNVVTSSTYAKTFVGGTPNDCHGHGTHVSGTAAARNNSFGVVGVAAGAKVIPVRVLNCSGNGSTSGIIAGINHVGVYDLPGDVANLSLGGYYGWWCPYFSSYISALSALGNAGTRVAIAAGNDASNAAYYQPACVNANKVYTVASMTCGKSWSSFSNYGRPPIDWIATGTSVYSTYKGGGYAWMDGTSMASPHVAGIMQVRNAAPLFGGNVYKNGVAYPIARR